MEEDKGSMIKLTVTNYSVWKPRMEDLLYCRDLFEPLENEGVKPENKPEKAWDVMNRKTVGQIRQWIDQSVFHHVANEKHAYTLWKKLEAMFERKSAQNKTYLIRKIVNLKYKDSRPVAEHLNGFQELVNKLTTLEIKLDDELQSLLLLSSFPDSWDTLVVSLSNSAPNGKITLEMVKDSMQNKETRRREQRITSDGDALITEHKGRSKSKKPPYNRGRSNDKQRYRSKSRGKVVCHYCDKPGHIKRFCRKFKRDQKNEEYNGEEASTAAVVSDADVIAVLTENLINFTCSETT